MNLNIVGAIIGIGGFILVGITTSWLLALGIIIMMWGNNVERKADLNKKLRDLYDVILDHVRPI